MDIVLFSMCVFGSIGYAIGARKGEGLGGAMLGFLLGPIGVVIVAISRPSQKHLDELHRRDGKAKCEWCAEWIRPEAKVCKHCGREQSHRPPLYCYESAKAPKDASAAWHTDPYKRFDERWWDGTSWTPKVRNEGVERVESGW